MQNHTSRSEHHKIIDKFCHAYDTILLAIREKKLHLVGKRDVLAFLGLLQLLPRAQHEKFLRALKSEIEALFQDGETHERRMLAVNLIHQIGEEELAKKLHGDALRLKLCEEWKRNRSDEQWKIVAFDLIRLGYEDIKGIEKLRFGPIHEKSAGETTPAESSSPTPSLSPEGGV